MIAIVMAGGKATRFSTRVEKAILDISGRTLLERSLSALRGGGISEVLVAATRSTRKTQALAKELSAEVVLTSGNGYHQDVLELLDIYRSFISLNVDVPFVQGQHVRTVAEEASGRSVAAVVPSELAMTKTDRDSGLADRSGRPLLWVGLNHVTPEPENHLLVIEEPLLTINVNDESDLSFARKIASERNL